MSQRDPVRGTAPVRFRPLAQEDFSLLHRWLNVPHVMAGYGHGRGRTPEEVALHYAPLLDGTKKTRGFIIEVGGRSAGFIQAYRILDHPEDAAAIGVFDESHGVDLFLGEPDLVGRGLGALVLRRFAEDVVFATTDAVAVVSDPLSTNWRSVRAFEKAGFRLWKTVTPPNEDCGDLLMRLDRPA